MSTLLAKNAEVLVTMDGQRRELKNAGIYIEEGFIKQIGLNGELPATADVVLDLSGQIVLPGFVNTHHHLNQTLTRNLVAAQNNNLFPWLQAQYRIWARTTEEASRASTLIALAELALSGCTTVCRNRMRSGSLPMFKYAAWFRYRVDQKISGGRGESWSWGGRIGQQ